MRAVRTCQAANAGVPCGQPAVWQHPTDRVWLCELHAPPAQERARCVVCGQLGAVRRPDTEEWFCLEHRPQ